MTTPDGRPSAPIAARHLGFEAGDAGVQANPRGGGQFTGGGEAQVANTNQDVSGQGGPDATSGLSKLRGEVANEQATQAQFVKED